MFENKPKYAQKKEETLTKNKIGLESQNKNSNIKLDLLNDNRTMN